MDSRDWVPVRSFDELATGMRVLVKPCGWGCGVHTGILSEIEHGPAWLSSGGIVDGPKRVLIGAVCAHGARASCDPSTVAKDKVFRYASDLGISDQLARETNPYVSRSVVGTAGRDEVAIARKERTR